MKTKITKVTPQLTNNEKNNYLLKALKNLTTHQKTKFYLSLIIGSITIAIATKFFIVFAQIYSPGLAGISQGITYSVFQEHGLSIATSIGMGEEQLKNMMFWLIYIFLNIPIFSFTYKKFGKDFLGHSVLVMAIGFLFTICVSFIPGIKDISIFDMKEFEAASKIVKTVIMLVMGSIAGIIYGLGVGKVFKMGYCSMGFDPIARYIATEKSMNISKILFLSSFLNSLFFIFLLRFLPNSKDHIIGSGLSPTQITEQFFQTFLDARFLATILFLSSYSIVVGSFYPTLKKVLVKINSLKSEMITNHFIKTDYHRNFSTYTLKGGHTKKQRVEISMLINQQELNDVISEVRKIDETAFIISLEVNNVFGNFVTKAQTLKEKKIREELDKKHRKK